MRRACEGVRTSGEGREARELNLMCAFAARVQRRHWISHYSHRLLLFAYLRVVLVSTLVICSIYDTFIVTFKVRLSTKRGKI